MTTLIAAGYASNAARTHAEIKVVMEDTRDFWVETVLGASARYELTLSSDTITLPDGATAGGCVYKIDTQGDIAADSLITISSTNTHDGQIIILMAENTARVVTVVSGGGNITLNTTIDSVDFLLNHAARYLILQKVGASWLEIDRGYGSDVISARNFIQVPKLVGSTLLAPADRLKIAYGSASTLSITANRIVLENTTGDQRSQFPSTWSSTLTLSATGANGRDVVDNGGLEQASSWYHLWAIATDAYNTRAVFATQACYPASATSIYARLPAGYTYAGYIGAWYNDSGSNLMIALQTGGYVRTPLGTPLSGGVATAITAVSLTAYVPVTARFFIGMLKARNTTTGANALANCYPTLGGAGGLIQAFDDLGGNGGPVMTQIPLRQVLETEQTTYYQSGTATSATTLYVTGWEF